MGRAAAARCDGRRPAADRAVARVRCRARRPPRARSDPAATRSRPVGRRSWRPRLGARQPGPRHAPADARGRGAPEGRPAGRPRQACRPLRCRRWPDRSAGRQGRGPTGSRSYVGPVARCARPWSAGPRPRCRARDPTAPDGGPTGDAGGRPRAVCRDASRSGRPPWAQRRGRPRRSRRDEPGYPLSRRDCQRPRGRRICSIPRRPGAAARPHGRSNAIAGGVHRAAVRPRCSARGAPPDRDTRAPCATGGRDTVRPSRPGGPVRPTGPVRSTGPVEGAASGRLGRGGIASHDAPRPGELPGGRGRIHAARGGAAARDGRSRPGGRSAGPCPHRFGATITARSTDAGHRRPADDPCHRLGKARTRRRPRRRVVGRASDPAFGDRVPGRGRRRGRGSDGRPGGPGGPT
jgi:hypothetical protein